MKEIRVFNSTVPTRAYYPEIERALLGDETKFALVAFLSCMHIADEITNNLKRAGCDVWETKYGILPPRHDEERAQPVIKIVFEKSGRWAEMR